MLDSEKKLDSQKRSKWKKFKNFIFRFKFFELRLKHKTKQMFKDIVVQPKRMSIFERIIKLVILLALRFTITKRHWVDKNKKHLIINRAYKRIIDSDFYFIPPAFAFYLIMAFVPIVLIILLISSQIPFIYEQMEWVLKSFTSGNEKIFIDFLDSVRSKSKIVTIVLIILLSFWIASSGFAKFIYTQSYIYKHENEGNYWKNRFRGMVIIVWIMIYFLFYLCFLALIDWFLISGLNLEQKSNVYLGWYYFITITISFLIIYLGFSLFFIFTPRFRQTWRQIHPGALATTIPTVIFIIIFTLLAKTFFRYPSYGILGLLLTVAAVSFQIAYFIYVGIIVNVVFYQTHFGKITFNKKNTWY